MNRRHLAVIAALAASFAVSPALYAAPAVHAPVHAMFGKSKTVKLTLINDSGSPMELKAGEEVIKLDAGKPVVVNLPAGTRLLATETTGSHQAGSVIAEVADSLNGATLHIK